MFSLHLILSLLLAAAIVGVVQCQNCAFIPGPITESNDTGVTMVEVDCQGRQRDSVGLADTTGNSTGVVVYLYNCTTVPVGMFVDVSAGLSIVTVVSGDSEVFLEETFEGLGNIAELRLEGFHMLQNLSSAVFRPLKNLERLILVRFGAHKLTYAELGEALYGLSGTPLSRVVMHKIHSIENTDRIVNVTALFRLQNVTIRELAFSDNIIEGISGQLSHALPHLSYVCIGTNAGYYAAVKVLLDAWLFLNSLTNMTVYAVHVSALLDTLPCGEVIPELDFGFIIITQTLLKHRKTGCYHDVEFPLPQGLKQLTLHQVKLTDDWHDEYDPICFENNNNVEYLDFSDSVLPINSTQITGLVNLRYLDLQNTGITVLPDYFLGHFPNLERIILIQLSIGKWMKHINSSFFGNCPTLREIHLGDCQLTTIPSTSFELLPAIEILNLSSNFLRTFDVSLSNNSNLSYLNLSDNAISLVSEDVLDELNEIAQLRLQAGETLTVDLRRNRLSCLCNSIRFIRQLQDWIIKQEVNIPGFDEYSCQYLNGSMMAVSQVDVHQLVSQCSVLDEFKNGSDCPCDDHLRQRLELVRLSLHGYVCRSSGGKLLPMGIHSLPICPDFSIYKSKTFISLVVVGCVLVLGLVVISIVLYRHRKNERLHRIIQRLSMPRIVRIGIQHVMAQNREDPSSFKHDVFLYIQDNDQEAARCWFDVGLSPHRCVLRDDDFIPGFKLETRLRNIWKCRWLVPVLSQSFVDDGECCDFIARAQYARPHAIVPVVWTEFHTDNLTINSLLDTAEPVTWPGDSASDVDRATFWKTLLDRTNCEIYMHEKCDLQLR